MRKSARRTTAAAAVCAALLGAVGLFAPTAQARAQATVSLSPARGSVGRAPGTAPLPGVEGQSATVTRPDGTQAQFALFSVNSPTNVTVWYQTQSVPGGTFGAWTQVSTMTVNFQNALLAAASDTDGSLEVFTIGFQAGGLVRIHQSGENGAWSAPESFAPAGVGVPRFFGAPVAFQRSDGTLVLFEDFQGSGSPELYVDEQSAPGVWGAWTDLGAGPLPATVATPSSVTEAPDGTLTAVSHMWDAPSMFARISQSPTGSWGPWHACTSSGCANG
ncbi:hypothetical protein ACFW1A_09600 [Kitasatospora sp. NPDC058965]|uniref:hypothetical protein n=1 Tax=Kitasatospora sp. NPDC058965 TaxID=3346682 RepID=UPI003675F1D2